MEQRFIAAFPTLSRPDYPTFLGAEMNPKRNKLRQPNTLLRFQREKRGWSQPRVAELLNTSGDMISRWERGVSKPSPYYQEKLCDLFGLSADQLGLIEQPRYETPYPDEQAVQERAEASLAPTRFLTMGPEELIERYGSEKEKLLELNIDGIAWTIPEVVVFDNTRSHLPLTAITVQPDKAYPEYSIPAIIAGKAADVLAEIEQYFYDSTTIRLNGIQDSGHGLTLTVAKAHFLQYIATNYAMDALLKEKGWTRSLRDTVHPTTQLCRLEESLLANHIGVNTLVFTLDNYLVIPFRSKENMATWRETISPSISGATSYDDDMWSFKAGPVASWIREGREELGLENSDFLDGSDIFLGITRDLLRGGKPEMCFATKLNTTRAKVEQKFKKARDRWENRELRWLEFTDPLTPPTTEQEQATFLREFLSLLSFCQDQLSRPAQVNLILWFKYMWYS